MNYHGTVKLIIGKVVKHEFAYFSREERNKTIERWRKIYGMGFENYELLIAPKYVKELRKPPEGETKLQRLQRESKVRQGRRYISIRNQKDKPRQQLIKNNIL